MAHKTKLEWVREEIVRQQKWIKEHGETKLGYIERYGSVHDEKHYGNGGEAIYEADTAALARLLAQEMNLENRQPGTPVDRTDLVTAISARLAEIHEEMHALGRERNLLLEARKGVLLQEDVLRTINQLAGHAISLNFEN